MLFFASKIHGLCTFFRPLLTPVWTALFFASLSVHGLHFTVYAPSSYFLPVSILFSECLRFLSSADGHQGSVTAGFQTVVRGLSREHIPTPHCKFSILPQFISVLPQVCLLLTSIYRHPQKHFILPKSLCELFSLSGYNCNYIKISPERFVLHVPLFPVVQIINDNYINNFLENYFSCQVTITNTRIIPCELFT